MRAIIRKITYAVCLTGVFVLFSGVGCRVSYTLSGASIHEDVKTVSIPFFPNSSSYVSPTLSTMLTDALREKFSNQTKLELITNGVDEGDMAFTGEITGTSTIPTAVTAAEEFAASQMRLTVRVRVNFVNNIQPEYNFQRDFTQYSDYPSSQTLQAAEGEHLPIIVKALADDIFNAAVQNW